MCKIVTAPSYVYLIGYGNRLKIGKSNNPEVRLRSLQTAIPETLNLLGVIACSSEAEAFTLEKKLHSEYSECHILGEWFDSSMINITYLLDKYGPKVMASIPQVELIEAMSELSTGAYKLLMYYYSRNDGWVFVDDNIAKAINSSARQVKKFRKELTDKGYLLVQKGQVDVYFIGKLAVRRFINSEVDVDIYEAKEPVIGK